MCLDATEVFSVAELGLWRFLLLVTSAREFACSLVVLIGENLDPVLSTRLVLGRQANHGGTGMPFDSMAHRTGRAHLKPTLDGSLAVLEDSTCRQLATKHDIQPSISELGTPAHFPATDAFAYPNEYSVSDKGTMTGTLVSATTDSGIPSSVAVTSYHAPSAHLFGTPGLHFCTAAIVNSLTNAITSFCFLIGNGFTLGTPSAEVIVTHI